MIWASVCHLDSKIGFGRQERRGGPEEPPNDNLEVRERMSVQAQVPQWPDGSFRRYCKGLQQEPQ